LRPFLSVFSELALVVVTDRQTDRQRDKHANFTYSPLYTEQFVRHIEIILTMALKSVIAGRVINLEVLSWTRSLAATEPHVME